MQRLTACAAAVVTVALAAPLRPALAQPAAADPAADPAAASAADADADLMAELEALEAKVDALAVQRGGHGWLTAQRADEIRALVQDVLADADTRASLLQDGVTAGYDNGFFIAGAGGNFRLDLSGVLQIRYAFSHVDDEDDPLIDSTRSGFENRRTALKFGGHVVDPTWKYFVHGIFSPATGSFFLLEGYVTKDLGDGWLVRVGKLRLPFLRAQAVSYTRQLAVERSLVTDYFGAGWAQGVEVAWQGERFTCELAFSDDIDGPAGRNRPALDYDTEYTFTGRVEYLARGSWKQFGDFSSFPGAETGLLLGAAFVWTDSEYGTLDVETEEVRWTADVSLAWSGATVFAAFMGLHADPNGPAPRRDQYGVVVQGGVFVTDRVELFARYEWADEDSAADDLSVLTVGFNVFWSGERLRWVNDVGYAFDGVTGTWANGGANWREDAPGADGQVVVRSQVQMLF